MSHAELKAVVDRSSVEDRLFLSAYLRHLASRGDVCMQGDLASAHREIEQGDKVNLRQMKRLHQTLAKSGL